MKRKGIRIWTTHPSARDGEISWVRITVPTSGEEFSVGGSTTHEEGWSSWHECYFVDNGHLILQSESDGRDCDGRLSTYAEYAARIVSKGRVETKPHWNAGGEYSSPDGLTIAWNDVQSGQRDYAAEAAGY